MTGKKQNKAKDLISLVGKNIRKYRLEKNLTQEQLEDASGVRVYKYESGQSDMTLTTLQKLSTHLGIEPWQLLLKK